MEKTRRSRAQIAQLLEAYRTSGMRRRQFCEQRQIPLTTLDYYQHKYGKRSPARLVKVKVKPPVMGDLSSSGFTLVLINGRRIESGWSFGDDAMARLIRLAEGS